ncbi:MAG TPA: ABC transporter permease [Gaiellaceae bacterium]|nr:ABC transporter permease [Gaiellaceae bacterium]
MTENATTAPEAPGTPAPGVPRRSLPQLVRRFLIDLPEWGVLVVVLTALVIVFWAGSPYFMRWDNLRNVLIAVSTVGILSCTTTMLLVAGQFDLSVGAGSSLVATIFAWRFAHGNGEALSVLIAVGVGLGIGFVNGFLVTVIGINALITTIATLAIMRNFAYIIGDGQAIQINGFTTLGLDRPVLQIPWMVFIFAAVALLTWLAMRYSVFGRSLYAIGANPTAARLSGIRVARVLFIGFILSGAAIALSGLIVASQTGQGTGNAGIGLELSAITAVVLGGASLAGGRGSIIGTILGVLIIGVINNGLTLLNIISYWQEVIRGLLLVTAVGFDQLRLRLTDR